MTPPSGKSPYLPATAEAQVINYNAFERICAEAVGCDRCFPKMGVARADVNIAQPRYVGSKYWTATDRRLFLMINPGAGNGSASDQALRQEIISYRNGQLNLEELFLRQRERFPDWGRGKFLAFIQKLGRSLDDIALLNIAWCATRGDKYPDKMLETCFEAHTRRAVDALSPTTIIACGGLAQAFARRAGLPFIAAPHYAARFAIDFAAIRKGIFDFVQAINWTELVEVIVSELNDTSKSKGVGRASRNPRYSDSDKIRLVRGSNPKTRKSAERYDCYRDGMTVAEYRKEVTRRLGRSEAGKCLRDLDWDVKRNFIRIEPR